MTPSYDDIISLPHHVSVRHPRMSLHDRAAQFAPFAALVGYEDAIDETARLTEERRELDEHEKNDLDYRLHVLEANLNALPHVTITYFIPDALKHGGKYATVAGRLQHIQKVPGCLVLQTGLSIPLADVTGIDSPLFE